MKNIRGKQISQSFQVIIEYNLRYENILPNVKSI